MSDQPETPIQSAGEKLQSAQTAATDAQAAADMQTKLATVLAQKTVLETQMALAVELSKQHMDYETACEIAKAITPECRILAGELTHPKYGHGAADIVDAYVKGPGRAWAARGAVGNVCNPAPIGSFWNIEEAVKNGEYLARWQAADPVGCDREFDKYLAEKRRKLMTSWAR